MADLIPLTLSRVLVEEHNQLRSQDHTIPECTPPWSIAPEEVLNSDDLVRYLQNSPDPLPSYLRKRLEGQIEGGLGAILKGLNQLIDDGKALYDPEGFSNVALSKRTAALLARSLELEKDDLLGLNRLLLDEGFPGYLRPVEQGEQGRLQEIYKLMHALPEGNKRSALCLSGGGIRSATFNLGVLQGLAEHGLLQQFDYLSTVSGGGYIGSWLSAWIKHAPEGLPEVAGKLKQSLRPDQANADPLDPEPSPIRFLRDYSNFIVARPGVLAADTWTELATIFRNLLLNWTVVVPLLLSVLMLPRLYMLLLQMTVPAPVVVGVVVVAGLLLLLPFWIFGQASWNQLRLARYDPSRSGDVSQAKFLCLFWLPLLISAILLTLSLGWSSPPRPRLVFIFVAVAVLLYVLSEGVFLIRFRRSASADRRKRVLNWVYRATLLLGLAAAVGLALAPGLALMDWDLRGAPQGNDFFLHPPLELLLYTSLAVPAVLALVTVVITVYVGIFSRIWEDDTREWLGRASGWLLIAVVVWAVACLLVLFGPLLLQPGWARQITIPSGVAGGLFTLIAGRSGKTPATPDRGNKDDLTSRLLNIAVRLIAPIFAAFLAIVLSRLGIWLYRVLRNVALPQSDSHVSHAIWLVLGLVFILSAFGYLMNWFVNINKFSMHSNYRTRLTRTYLGASHLKRTPDKFTGFDENDNMPMSQLWPDAKRDERAYVPRSKLFHVICCTLNLVGGENLAWQERKAETFTISPLHGGSLRLGYRRSSLYGGPDGISLATAMTISGAAASPNMGYHSSPVVTLLLALFNVRLGWWLGNPGLAGQSTYKFRSPRQAIRSFIDEAFGLTNDRNGYVYLSDGGHFENLGLYEMVLRRCHIVVVSDATQDPNYTFEDVGNAVRKIRIDLGIPIVFDRGIHVKPPESAIVLDGGVQVKPPKPARDTYYCAVGHILYSHIDENGEDGYLIYIKPVVDARDDRVPSDVQNYKNTSPTFPQESTFDLFYSESQFESYRALGAFSVGRIVGDPDGSAGRDVPSKSLSDLLERAFARSGHEVCDFPTVLDGERRPRRREVRRWDQHH